MNVLIVFATTDGQTRKVATFMADRFSALGHAVTLVDVDQIQPNPGPDAADAIVVAASIHVGRYQSSIIRFVKASVAALRTKPNAFVSVSLTAANEDRDERKALRKWIGQFRRRTGWQPRRVHHVAGAFRYTQYGLLRRWAMLLFALRRGASTDTTRDHELTDWDDLRRFVDDFAGAASRGAS